MRRAFQLAAAVVMVGWSLVSSSAAEDFRCEVLELKGEVTVVDSSGESRSLKTGDLVKEGETIAVGPEGFADLAYDNNWNNVMRFESNTRAKIEKIAPAKSSLEKGSIFSKLKSIPKDSTFEIKTPTAIATVRGTEYRTQFRDGKTDVFNDSSSKVYVYGVLPDGSVNKDDAVILYESKKTSVASSGVPGSAAPMTPEEAASGKALSETVQKKVEEQLSKGRMSSIQSISDIESYLKEIKKSENKPVSPGLEDKELSRITDSRRRAFGGGSSVMVPPEPDQPAPSSASPGQDTAPVEQAVSDTAA